MSTNSPSWYIPGDGKQPAGPFTAEQVVQWWKEGRLHADAVCWREGMPQWLPLSQVEPFASAVKSARTSQHTAPSAIPRTLPELVALWDRCMARVRNAVAADKRLVPLAAGIAILAILVIVVLTARGIGSHSEVPVRSTSGSREAGPTEKEAARIALDLWNPTRLGRSWYVWAVIDYGMAPISGGGTRHVEAILELREPIVTVSSDFGPSEAEKLNGLEWSGWAKLDAKVSRYCVFKDTRATPDKNWSQWCDGVPTQLYWHGDMWLSPSTELAVRLRRINGKWKQETKWTSECVKFQHATQYTLGLTGAARD